MKRFVTGVIVGAMLTGGTVGAATIGTQRHRIEIDDRTDRVRVVMPVDTAEDDICFSIKRNARGERVAVVRLIDPDKCRAWQAKANR